MKYSWYGLDRAAIYVVRGKSKKRRKAQACPANKKPSSRMGGFSEDLRRRATNAEKRMKRILTEMNVEYRFQHVVGQFILDFYLMSLTLGVEIDGGYHLTDEQKAKDDKRQKRLDKLGIKVIRFTNEETLDSENIKGRLGLIIRNRGIRRKRRASSLHIPKQREVVLPRNVPSKSKADIIIKKLWSISPV